MTDEPRGWSRRRALRAGAVALGAGLAGCSGGRDRRGGAASGGGGRPESTPTAGGPTLATHPAGRSIADQPYQGPEPGTATATIVAFEDPSCPACAAFERRTVPKIHSNLVEPGRATYVFRGFPVVYPWGKPASAALEATFERDPAAHWPLAFAYFGNQRSISMDNVLPKTRAFLDSETDVDGDAVVKAVEAGEATPAVKADTAAARDAGARGTPTIFLFRDGEYRTKATGSVSYDVIESALGL